MMKSREKWICRFLLMMLTVVCFTAPAGFAEMALDGPKTCEEIVAAIAAGQAFEELTPQDIRELVAYIGMAEEDLTDGVLWIDASAATVEMVGALTARDGEALKRVQRDLDWFLEDLTEAYRDYVPEEIPKLERAVVEVRGLQLVFVISKDASAAKAGLDEAWKP